MKARSKGHKLESGHIQTWDAETGKHDYAHREAAEKKLGRKLRKGEVVHHLDGDPSNNSPSNLEVLPGRGRHNSKDPSLHHGGRKKGR